MNHSRLSPASTLMPRCHGRPQLVTTLLAGSLLAAAAVPPLAPAAEPPTPRFKMVEIDARIDIGYGVAVADVNGDRKPDVLLADKHAFVWYENPGWQKHILAERLTSQDHVCLAAHDLDGSSRCSVAVGAGWNPGDTLKSGAVFHLEPSADRAQRWTPVPLPHEPTVHRMRWSANNSGGHDLVMVPLHGRGNKPATGEGEGVRILAYRPPANRAQATNAAAWTTTSIATPLHKTHNFDPVQWDQDPEQEWLVASLEGVHLVDRQAQGAPARFTRLSGTESGGAGEVRLGRLANGKRFFATVEPMHGTNLVFYAEPAAAPGAAGAAADPTPLWTRQVLDSTLVDGHALACADFLGAGSDQIVVGWRAMGRPGARVGIRLFAPLNPHGSDWRPTLIDDNGMACEDLCVADLNGDRRPDIIAAGRATRNVRIYLNETRP